MVLRLRLYGRADETKPQKTKKWSICRLVSRIVHKFDKEKAHPYMTIDNALTTDPLPAFVYSDYPEAITSADGTFRTGILDLPVELLLEICQYSRFSDVYSLIRVNTILHAVGVQRFYSFIIVRLGNIRLPFADQLPDDAPLREVLPHLKGKRPSMLWGLFTSQKHLDAVRTVVFCSGYNRRRYGVLDTLVQGIFLLCPTIRNVIIKGRSKWHEELDKHISFKGVTFPESLSTVHLDAMSTLTQTLLSGISSVTVLEIQGWEGPHSLDQISSDLGVTLIELKCQWDFSLSPTEDIGDFSKRLVTLFPNVKRLEIGYKTVEEGENVHMSPAILDAYLSVTRDLHNLEDLTLLFFGHQEHSTDDTNTITLESDSIQQFIKARPSLQRVTLHNYIHYGSECVFKEAITWKKSKEDNGKETWTFDPMITGN